MKIRIFSLLLTLFSGYSFVQSQTIHPLTNEQKNWLSTANRHEKNGWIYLHIEGAPKIRGFQHGYLLANEIKESIRIVSEVWHYQTALDLSWLVKQSGKLFTPKVDSENLAEIDGMVEGMVAAGVPTTLDEMVAYNGSLEIIGYWFPTVKDTVSPNSPEPRRDGCSSFIATGNMTREGNIVLGHNTFSSLYSPMCNVILDILPETGYRILMQTNAGFIHSGSDFFVTSAGIVGSETTIGGFFPFDVNGIPEFVRMRRACQYGSNLDEWCAIMKKGNNGGYANAWLIGDINTREIARLELGLKYIGFEKKKDGYFTGSNVPEDVRILRLETHYKETNIKYSDVARRVRWKQLMKENAGKINLELAKAFEADHYDPYLHAIRPGGRTLCGHFDLDKQEQGTSEPYYPEAALDGKVVDASMARQMSFLARWGSSCGIPFNAKSYLAEHPQYDWMTGLLVDRPSQPWTIFKAGEKK